MYEGKPAGYRKTAEDAINGTLETGFSGASPYTGNNSGFPGQSYQSSANGLYTHQSTGGSYGQTPGANGTTSYQQQPTSYQPPGQYQQQSSSGSYSSNQYGQYGQQYYNGSQASYPGNTNNPAATPTPTSATTSYSGFGFAQNPYHHSSSSAAYIQPQYPGSFASASNFPGTPPNQYSPPFENNDWKTRKRFQEPPPPPPGWSSPSGEPPPVSNNQPGYTSTSSSSSSQAGNTIAAFETQSLQVESNHGKTPMREGSASWWGTSNDTGPPPPPDQCIPPQSYYQTIQNNPANRPGDHHLSLINIPTLDTGGIIRGDDKSTRASMSQQSTVPLAPDATQPASSLIIPSSGLHGQQMLQLPGLAGTADMFTPITSSLPGPTGMPLNPVVARDAPEEPCEVCWDCRTHVNPQSGVEEESPKLQCQVCGVRVHSECYGVPPMQQSKLADETPFTNGSDWCCFACLYWKQLGGGRGILYCSLCSRPGGAMKVGAEGKWIHVNCVLFSREGPYFRNFSIRSAPVGIQKSIVMHSRCRYVCSFCRLGHGYTTVCAFPGCEKRVHVSCCFERGAIPKLLSVFADVPVMYNAVNPGAAEGYQHPMSEMRMIERLIKIVTCVNHAKKEAYSAIEIWEEKLMRKTDAASTVVNDPYSSFMQDGRGSTTWPMYNSTSGTAMNQPSQQQQGQSGGSGTPMGNPRFSASSQNLGGVSNMQQMGSGLAPPPSRPMSYYPQATAQQYYPRPSPYYWMQSGAGPPGYPFPYRSAQPGTRYPYPVYQTPPAGQSPYFPPYWPGPYGPTAMMARPHQPQTTSSGYHNRSTTGGVRVAVGVNRGLSKPKRPEGAASSKLGLSGLQPKIKQDILSPKKASLKKPKAKSDRKKKSGLSTTSVGPITKKDSTTKTRPLRQASVARKDEDDTDDLGTACGHIVGAAVSTRGSRVNWSKADPYFQSLREATTTTCPVFTFFDSLETEMVNRSDIDKWHWIFSPTQTPDEPHHRVESESRTEIKSNQKMIEYIRKIWLKEAQPISSGFQAPVSAIIRSEVSSNTNCPLESLELWTFWTLTVSHFQSSPPAPQQITSAGDSQLTLVISKMASQMIKEGSQMIEEGSQSYYKVSLKSAYRLGMAESKYLESHNGQCTLSEVVEEPTNLSMELCQKAAPPVEIKGLFDELVERAILRGDRDPTGFISEMMSKGIWNSRKHSIDVMNWHDIQRVETVIQRYSVPKFFILLKKLPAEIVKKIRNTSASVQVSSVQKYLSSKESVGLNLDPSIMVKLGVMSKRVYMHGHIWDLNPGIPRHEPIMRKFLDSPGSIPIADEVNKDRLNFFLRTGPVVEDEGKWRTGQELHRLVSSIEYWQHLFSEDNFVLRQSVYHFLLWLKKRSRLKVLSEKLRKVINEEQGRKLRSTESMEIYEPLMTATGHVFRWSSLRNSVMLGHQDPSQLLLEKMENPDISAAKIFFCSVCFGSEMDNLNPLINCHTCGVRVHKNCYAVGTPAQLDFESLQWMCDKCNSKINAHCAICLRPGGALKKIHDYVNTFVHITCALWLYPDFKCQNLAKLTKWIVTTPDAKLPNAKSCQSCLARASAELKSSKSPNIAMKRKSRVVQLEEEEEDDSAEQQTEPEDLDDTPLNHYPWGRRGLPIQCSFPECPRFYHPICAWLDGLKVGATENFDDNIMEDDHIFAPSLNIKFLCAIHSNGVERLLIDIVSKHRLKAYYPNQDLSSIAELPFYPRQATLSPTVPPVILPPLEPTPSELQRRPSIPLEVVALKVEARTIRYPEGTPTRLLAGPDVYCNDICQNCFRKGGVMVNCPQCKIVWTCEECSVEILNEVCSSCCAAPEQLKCALCPRLGGCLVLKPLEQVEILVAPNPITREQLGPLLKNEDITKPQTLLGTSAAEIEPALSDIGPSEITACLPITPPLICGQDVCCWVHSKCWDIAILSLNGVNDNSLHHQSTSIQCEICSTGGGFLLHCSKSKECDSYSHGLCSALTGQSSEYICPNHPEQTIDHDPNNEMPDETAAAVLTISSPITLPPILPTSLQSGHSSTPTSSDTGPRQLRKRNRRIVHAESDEDGQTTPVAIIEDHKILTDDNNKTLSEDNKTPAPEMPAKRDLIPRKRHQSSAATSSAPPSAQEGGRLAKRPRTSSVTSLAGTVRRTPATTPTAAAAASNNSSKSEARRKTPTLPLRNEKGQFIKKSATTRENKKSSSAAAASSRNSSRWT